MSRSDRILLPETVVLLTSRVQQGLPFVPTPQMEHILWSALAVAYNLHPIKIISFVIMGNHVHLIILVEDPTNVESFMERFKCETAHAVNRLLGRRQVSVWCEGYDSPAILTEDDLIEKIAYVYANPVRARLTDSIDNYLGVSSWQMFTSASESKEIRRVRRNFLSKIPRGRLSQTQLQRLAMTLMEQTKEIQTFSIFSSAWQRAFPNGMTMEEFKQRVTRRVREIETEVAELRKKRKTALPSPLHLVTQPMDIRYMPTNFSRRMWCISRDVHRRVAFITLVKDLKKARKIARAKWQRGDWTEPFPPGLFPSCAPIIANLLPAFVKRSIY